MKKTDNVLKEYKLHKSSQIKIKNKQYFVDYKQNTICSNLCDLYYFKIYFTAPLSNRCLLRGLPQPK
jgi:hypothetical protein